MSGNVSKRSITLEPFSVGALVSEATRAHLHGGTPSALLNRIRVGVATFMAETHNAEDRRLADTFLAELDDIIKEWKPREDLFLQDEEPANTTK